MQRLILLGLNHTTAPLEVRERLAFAAAQRDAAVRRFRERFESAELVLLATCNRVELYVARATHARPRIEDLAAFLGDCHQVDPAHFRPHLYDKAERDAVEHLFAVTASLDSMVLGETQILGQVRQAYEASCGLGAAGPTLNPLFQRALAVGKQVMSETRLAEGRVSVASVAVDHARRIFERFEDKTVLCIGAGKMAELAIQSFVALRPGGLLICNRDSARAQRLAGRFRGIAVPFAELEAHVAAADVVITSTGSPEPILGRAQFDSILRQRRYRPIFVIDIAVPRNVDAAAGQLDHVYLYNLDDLQQVVMRTMSQRSGAVESARAIVLQHVNEYLAWTRQRELGPTIDRLYRRMHEMAQEELERTLGKMPQGGEAERALLEEMTRRIVNKFLHDPVHMLRYADERHGPASQYVHALERLFQLDAEEGESGTSK